MKHLDKMEQYIKQSSFRKHLNFIWIKLQIALKENKEYKSNLIGYFISDTVILISYMTFYSVVNKLIGNNLNWQYLDFWIFFIILAISAKLMYNFTIRRFSSILLTGKLNITKNQPINQYINETNRNINGGGLVSTSLFVLYLIITLITTYNNYSFLKIILFFISLIFGIFYFFAFINFFETFGFFFKNTETTTRLVNNEINYINEKFTPKVFEKTNFKTFFYLLPSAIYGYIPVEVLRGNFQILFTYLPYLVITFLIFIISTLLLWHLGLKKYEAYN